MSTAAVMHSSSRSPHPRRTAALGSNQLESRLRSGMAERVSVQPARRRQPQRPRRRHQRGWRAGRTGRWVGRAADIAQRRHKPPHAQQNVAAARCFEAPQLLLRGPRPLTASRRPASQQIGSRRPVKARAANEIHFAFEAKTPDLILQPPIITTTRQARGFGVAPRCARKLSAFIGTWGKPKKAKFAAKASVVHAHAGLG